MGEWVLFHLVGSHITLGKGLDGIAIAPGTTNPPTHNTTTQTPWLH